MAYRSRGQYGKAAVAFAREAQNYTAPEAILIWTIATIELAITRRMQGKLRESGEICRRALLRIADQGALPFVSLARLDTVLGDILREQNALDEAYHRVSEAIERVQSWVMPTDRLTFYLTLIRVQEAQGDLAGAYETLRQAKELKAAHPVFLDLARMVDLYEIRLALANHEFAAADSLMNGLQPGTSRSVFLRDQELILLARLRLAQGRPDEALAICSPLRCCKSAADACRKLASRGFGTKWSISQIVIIVDGGQMSKPIALRPLTDEEHTTLEKIAKSQTAPARRVERASN